MCIYHAGPRRSLRPHRKPVQLKPGPKILQKLLGITFPNDQRQAVWCKCITHKTVVNWIGEDVRLLLDQHWKEPHVVLTKRGNTLPCHLFLCSTERNYSYNICVDVYFRKIRSVVPDAITFIDIWLPNSSQADDIFRAQADWPFTFFIL